jgi:HK97 gp10 family phage protein
MSGFAVIIKGVDRLKAKAGQMAKRLEGARRKAIRVGAYMIHKTAQERILPEGKTGVTYTLYRPKREHTASAPGESPASDRGGLRRGLIVVMDAEGAGASIVSRADYSKALEFGSRGDPSRNIPPLAPRPFMGPAFEQNRAAIAQLIRDAMKEALRQ